MAVAIDTIRETKPRSSWCTCQSSNHDIQVDQLEACGYEVVPDVFEDDGGTLLRYCRNVHPTWVKFNSKDTKESEWCSRF